MGGCIVWMDALYGWMHNKIIRSSFVVVVVVVVVVVECYQVQPCRNQ